MREHSKENIQLGKLVFYVCIILSIFALSFCRGQVWENAIPFGKAFNSKENIFVDTNKYVTVKFDVSFEKGEYSVFISNKSETTAYEYRLNSDATILIKFGGEYTVSFFNKNKKEYSGYAITINTKMCPKRRAVIEFPDKIEFDEKNTMYSGGAVCYCPSKKTWCIVDYSDYKNIVAIQK